VAHNTALNISDNLPSYSPDTTAQTRRRGNKYKM